MPSKTAARSLSRMHLRFAVSVLFAFVISLTNERELAAQQQFPQQSQDPQQVQDDPQQVQQPSQPTNPAQLTSVHGLVRNGASGEPLPRALVRISGDASTGVLTDGDGRFEIPDVPEGPQEFTVTKPGFIDRAEAADNSVSNSQGYGHNIIVLATMGDVLFSMLPLNSIRGQVQLSTGDLAQGITVSLLKRAVQDGRAVWKFEANARTNSEGVYRFGELLDGTYSMFTEPAMDSDAQINLVEAGARSVMREGYAGVFYPDASDSAGAAKIHVSGGEQAQANFPLILEPFQPVTAIVTAPGAMSGADDNVAIEVTDAQAHALPYAAEYDAATHTAKVALPDGSYRFVATRLMTPPHLMHQMIVYDGATEKAAMVARSDPQSATGEVSFTVAGHAVSNLRIPLALATGSPIQVILQRSANGSASTGNPHIVVTLSQAGGGLGEGMVASYAEGVIYSAPLQTQRTPPGSYWVHTSIAPRGLCEASFTAGGASLAQEQLVISASGATAPLVLTLRDDCAQLTLSLPESVGLSAGEEHYYIVYAVPDFDATQDVIPQTLRPSSGGRVTLTGLTPGNYHVYTFNHPVTLEYRNPEVLAELSGQSVALAPGAEAQLTVEVPQR